MPTGTHEYDAFLSHAGEDKRAIAEPLAEALEARGIHIWLDKLVMTIGDSLNRSIDAGLAKSRFGIVVLSPSFFAKEWPRRELDGLVAREIAGHKVILPVWHQIGRDGVLRFSPTLADRMAAESRNGIDATADSLVTAIQRGTSTLTGAATVLRGSSSAGSKSIFCAYCGQKAGDRSYCMGSRSFHEFKGFNDPDVFCIHCGQKAGDRSYCMGSRSFHEYKQF